MDFLHIILWVSTFFATIHGCSKKKRPSEPKPKPALIKGKNPVSGAAKKGSDGEKKSKEKEMKSKEMVTKSKEKEIKSKEETKSKEEVKKPPMDFSEALKHEKTYNRDLTVEEVNKTVEHKPEPSIDLKPKGSTTTAKNKIYKFYDTLESIKSIKIMKTAEDISVPFKVPRTAAEEEASFKKFQEEMDREAEYEGG